MKTKEHIELENDYQELRVKYWIMLALAFVFIIGTNIVGLGELNDSLVTKHRDSLFAYCKKVTGKESSLSFDNDGNFLGCETVVR